MRFKKKEPRAIAFALIVYYENETKNDDWCIFFCKKGLQKTKDFDCF